MVHHALCSACALCFIQEVLKREGEGTDTACFVASSSIKEGEELCISYIEQSLPLHEREQALDDYLFTCACPLCVLQRG